MAGWGTELLRNPENTRVAEARERLVLFMRVEDLSWVEYQERIGGHLVVLPIGAIEAHGPHLPLATDTVVSTFLADGLSKRVDALVLPPIAYGCKTTPGKAGGSFPGMTNLRASTLTNLVLDILTASYGHGARKFLILHGHIANVPFVFEALDLFMSQAPDATVMAASWWDLTSEKTRNAIACETGVDRFEDHHAAMVETSLMMHIAPGSVRHEHILDDASERRIRYVVLPVPDSVKTRWGVVYRASKADPRIGSRLMSEILENLVDAVRKELGGTVPPEPDPGRIFVDTPVFVIPPLGDRYGFPSSPDFDGTEQAARTETGGGQPRPTSGGVGHA